MNSHRSLPRQLLLWLVGVWIFAPGCSDPGTKVCNDDSICSKQEICIEGKCISGCRTDKDCPAELFCRSLVCTKQICEPGATRECYDGPEETKGKGPCQVGFQLCTGKGESWTPCYEQTVPVAEICDYADNDCDGTSDEELSCGCEPGMSRRCYTGPTGTKNVGLCREGIQYCDDKRLWGPCQSQLIPLREICDHLDNDCNGLVDDQISCECKAGATRECYSGPPKLVGQGICNKGSQVCSSNNKWGPCLNQHLPVLEEEEVCNGKDDDCDGNVDNVSGTRQPLKELCYSALPGSLRKGACKQGLRTCNNGQWSKCEGEVVPIVETCNKKDDDCDGLIDNGIQPRSCYTGKVGCEQRQGSYRCQGACTPGQQRCFDGAWQACEGEVQPMSQEVCGDGKDNDCNGQIDDNCVCKTGQTRACYTGAGNTRQVGACRDGEETCVDNKWGACIGDVKPTLELCNGKDDNCDGATDNITGICTLPGKNGICANGNWVCEKDKRVCKVPSQGSTEVCNGKDDDCDGLVDNIAELGKACSDPLQNGVCAEGKWSCSNNQKRCLTTNKPTTEVCDGKDNDCDGSVDNVKGSCQVPGKQGVCQAGVKACDSKQQSVCRQTVLGYTEICNEKDDDCNGFIDDIKDLGKACQDPLRFGVCKPGILTCQKGKLVCLQQVQPSKEVCNGKDDDCDGVVDPGCSPCTKNLDCKTGMICIQGYCIAGECVQSTDCTGGKVCKSFRCVACAQDADCAGGQYCEVQQGQCKIQQCKLNRDCPTGMVCRIGFVCGLCQSNVECGTGSTCRNGLCSRQCTQNADCSSVEACQRGQCYPTCKVNADCPKGFACQSNVCWNVAVLEQGAFRWSDRSYASSCIAYRHPPAGYVGSLTNGGYWIKVPSVTQPFRVMCDMTSAGGGWMLLARYRSNMALKDWKPTAHQLQDLTGGKTVTTPPDLTNTSTFGHLQYSLFPVAERELKLQCRRSLASPWYAVTSSELYQDYKPGEKGVGGSNLWGFVGYNMVARTASGLCGRLKGTSGLYGIGYCKGTGSSVNVNQVSFGFLSTSGGMTFGCNGGLGSGDGEVWLRELGKNPLVKDPNGVRFWKDGTYASTCLDYYNSVGGQYSGKTGSGPYWIKPQSNGSRIKVYCDMERDGGGWTLLGRYISNLGLKDYNPHKHQIQDSQQGQTLTQPPDLNQANVYGHIAYNLFPVKGRSLRITCELELASPYSATGIRNSLFDDWTFSTKGTVGKSWATLELQGTRSNADSICGSANPSKNCCQGIGFCQGSSTTQFGLEFHYVTQSGSLGVNVICSGTRNSKTPRSVRDKAELWLR